MLDEERVARLLKTGPDEVIAITRKFHSHAPDPEFNLMLSQLSVGLLVASNKQHDLEFANLLKVCLETAFNMGVQWNEANRGQR